MLTPAQIKEVIVAAAEEQELEVGIDPTSQVENSRALKKMKVKVFNPVTHLRRALKLAKTKIESSS